MGTTITIGIVHDDGIAGDNATAQHIDEAVEAACRAIDVDLDAAPMPNGVWLEQAALFPVTIVGLVAVRSAEGEVDLSRSSVFYRFASQSSGCQSFRTSPAQFLDAYPVQVLS